MAALATVARGDDRLAPLAPRRDHALHGLGREVGPVGEHDHRGLPVERAGGAPSGQTVTYVANVTAAWRSLRGCA